MRIAVIPARGGSKRIPRKNIKYFYGKPIIAWSIQAALESKCFDLVIVSTDDDEIADVARSYGAAIPFMRPKELSDDYTGTIPVISHAVEWQNSNGKEVTEACCIYATAPFIQPGDIRYGLEALCNSNADYCISVTSYPFPIQRAIRLTINHRVEMFAPENFSKRSQDLEESWHDAAQFYWGKSEAWLNKKKIFTKDTVAINLPRHRVQDIDTVEDWRVAEIMFGVNINLEKK